MHISLKLQVLGPSPLEPPLIPRPPSQFPAPPSLILSLKQEVPQAPAAEVGPVLGRPRGSNGMLPPPYEPYYGALLLLVATTRAPTRRPPAPVGASAPTRRGPRPRPPHRSRKKGRRGAAAGRRRCSIRRAVPYTRTPAGSGGGNVRGRGREERWDSARPLSLCTYREVVRQKLRWPCAVPTLQQTCGCPAPHQHAHQYAVEGMRGIERRERRSSDAFPEAVREACHKQGEGHRRHAHGAHRRAEGSAACRRAAP